MKLWEKIYLNGPVYSRGDSITVEDEELLVLRAEWRCVVVTRHRRMGTFFYRVGRSLRYAEQYLVVILGVWGLAEWDPILIPTWRDVHLLRKLAGVWSKITGGKDDLTSCN